MLINLIQEFIVFKNEFLSKFVPQKVPYKVEGACNKCGKCCRHIVAKDMWNEKEFKILQFLFPSYKNFYIKEKTKEGELIFACSKVNEDGTCSVYEKRPSICRRYPEKIIYFCGELHDGCGFKVSPVKSFEDYLKK